MSFPTTVVVARNEAAHLEDCLRSLPDRADAIVVDLESTDASSAVAHAAGAEVWTRSRKPLVEQVLAELVPSLSAYDWILRIDPDERVPVELAAAIAAAIADASAEVASFDLPWQFYFKGKPLRGTVWGGPKWARGRLFKPSAVSHSPHVHHVAGMSEGFHSSRVQGAPLEHQWASSYKELLRKHHRYLRHEGQAMHARGVRWSVTGLMRAVLASFHANFVRSPCLRDGITGLLLSAVHLDYVIRAWLALRRWETAPHQ